MLGGATHVTRADRHARPPTPHESGRRCATSRSTRWSSPRCRTSSTSPTSPAARRSSCSPPIALLFITDFRYADHGHRARRRRHPRARTSSWCWSTARTTRRWRDAGRRGACRVGFEAAHLTVSRHRLARRRRSPRRPPAPQLVPTEGIVERARVVKDAYEIGRAARSGAAAVGGGGGDVRRCAARAGPSGRSPAASMAHPRSRVRAAGVRDDRRQRAERRAAARAADRAKINRRRPRRAGLWRRLRLILRRLDPDGVGRAGRRARPGGVRGGARRPRPRRSPRSGRGSRGSRSTPRRATALDGGGHGRGVRPRHRARARASKCTKIPRIVQRRPDVDTRDESGRAGHGVHDRAGRVLSRLGRRPDRRRCAGDRERASSC